MDGLQIQTERLRLRGLRLEDAAALFRYRSLEEVARYQSWHPKTIAEAQAFIRSMQGIEPGTLGTWLQLAVCLSGGELIGDIGVHFLEHAQLEIGYTLSPQYQGKGYGTEAVGAVIAHAFSVWQIHRLSASVDPDNSASIRLLERLGFRREGRFVKSYWSDGQWADDCIYAILEEEWLSRSAQPAPE